MESSLLNIISNIFKKKGLVIFIFTAPLLSVAQGKIDSLKHRIANTKTDTAKIDLYEKLGQAYRDEKKVDSSVFSYQRALEINEKYKYWPLKQCWDMAAIDYLLFEMGNYTESLNYASRDLALLEKLKSTFDLGFAHLVFGHDYRALGYYRESLNHYFKARQFFKSYYLSINKPEDNIYTIQCIGNTYLKMNLLDSALIFTQQAYKLAVAKPGYGYILYAWRMFGDIYLAKQDDRTALNYYRQYISNFVKYKENSRDEGFVFINVAKIYKKNGRPDSAIFYAKKALANAQKYSDQENIYNASTELYNFYEGKDNYKIATGTKENANNTSELNKGKIIPTNGVGEAKIDSLKHLIANTKADTAKIILLEKLGEAYRNEKKVDSSIVAYKRSLLLNEQLRYSQPGQRWELASIDYMLYETGNYLESLNYAQKELALTEKMGDKFQTGFVHLVFGHNYRGLGYYRESLNHYFKAKQLIKSYYLSRNEPEDNIYTIQCIGNTYLKMGRLDSALIFTQQAYKLAMVRPDYGYILYSWRIFGDIYLARGDDETALSYYRRYISNFVKYKERNRDEGFVFTNVARIYKKNGQADSAIFYAKKALTNAQKFSDQENLFNAGTLLADSFEGKNEHEALKYLKIATLAKDSMLSLDKSRQAQALSFNQQVREKEQAAAEAKEASRRRLLIIIAGIVISIISFLIWNRIRQLRLKHKMILEQKESEKLRAIDKMKEKFFSNITHELRTPLSLIMSPAQFYLEHPEELKDPGKLLESVFKNSGYLLNLINQLLDISKLDAGKLSVTLSKGDFGNYINDFVKTFVEQADKKQIELRCDNQLEGEYLFDEEHWKKIINNLVGNALKFTPAKGNVFVSVNKIAASAESSTVQLKVEDTGIGIDENELPFITDRFYQADNKLSRKYEGTGIGLALVNELVNLMNGKLTVASEKGKGSVFTITTTLLSAKEKDDHPEVVPIAKATGFSTKSADQTYIVKGQDDNIPVILITEDNQELRDFLRDSIEPLYKVITAQDGGKGFEVALSQIPDLIISDVMMPVMDGFEFCDKVKTNPATSHIPFLILSAKTTYESKITGLQKGADDYLTKPFSVDELRTKIKNILHGQEMLRKRFLEQLTEENPLPSFTDMQDDFLKRTFKIIEQHLDDSQLSVEMLAAKMNLNGTTLNRKFSFFLGLSANELIRQFRIKKEKMEHNLLELEVKTLRAQMNPHFIFNCMNSIKSLIQLGEGDKAVTYLTTFSKLLRTILQNSEEREITLYDELETCKLYVQLEAMRSGNKFTYQFDIDGATDLKSIKIPALIIQPFIENAIWHGIMPKEDGGNVSLTVSTQGNSVSCVIEDNGIGRERSKRNEFNGGRSSHQSKGIYLTQNRLNLDGLLNSRNSKVKIIDKYDEHEKAAGTIVVLTFDEY